MKWRTAQPVRSIKKRGRTRKVGKATARRDLETLRAAIRKYHAETPLLAVPVVTLPGKSQARMRWLTRSETAELLWQAWRSKRRKHLARFILIGIYTGTRATAILNLHWHPSPVGGWFDLDAGVMHRRGTIEAETKKRRPPSRIPRRLLPHLRRWRAMDLRAIATDKTKKHSNLVVHYYGRPLTRPKTVWNADRIDAKLGPDVTPHVLRHTAVTWQMQRRVDLWEAAGFFGMSVEVLQDVYGHHHPDYQWDAANAL